MKKTLITLLALCGVAAAAEPVQSGTITLDYTNAPKIVTDDATLYNYLYGTFNEGGTLTFALTLQREGNSVSHYQTILHIGAEGKGLTLGVNGSSHLMFGEGAEGTNGFGDAHELMSADLKVGSGEAGTNYVVYTLKFKETGKASASITLNNTEYAMNDMLWSTIAMSPEAEHYNKYTLGYRGPGWDGGLPMANISTDSMLVTYTAIPEPATATLSLLALCGLAARRRRK